MKTMKKNKILAENQQKIEKSTKNLQKMEENPKFSAGVGEMLLWDMIPELLNSYYAFFDKLSLIYKTTIITEEKNHGKGKKEIGK